MRTLLSSLLLSLLLLPRVVSAQEAEVQAQVAAEPAPVPADPPPGGPAPTGPAPAAEAAPRPVPDAPIEVDSERWYDDLSIGIFADAYYMADWNFPADPQAWSGVPHRAYDDGQGFGLAFAGADLVYDAEKVGGTISLRYGQGGASLIGGRASELSVLWQGFLTWKPTEKLAFDLGQFGTIYGAEVAESWVNLNYTRGALYYLMQPFYHTGLRATYELTTPITLKGMVVNGTNNLAGTVGLGEDGNQSPHVGAQVGFSPSELFGVYLGYYTGAGSSGFGGGDLAEDGDWEHFVDLVGTASLGKLSLVGNFDLYALPSAEALYWGLSLAAGYRIVDTFGVALRGEILQDPDGFISGGAYEWLGTATLTLDYQPVEQLAIRLDTRLEVSDTDAFIARNELRGFGLTSTLGVVAHYGM